jgi:hypothetical protein
VKENLFWTGTELDVAYVPLNVRRQPFYAPENVLCIDLDSPCVDPSGQKMLVNPDGSDSSFLKGMLSVLGELAAGKTATEQFIATLLSLELLAPMLLDILLDDKTPLQLHGLYGLDEERFRQIGESEIAELWKSGQLDLVYAVLLASGQIFKLIRLKNQRIALGRAWHSNVG